MTILILALWSLQVLSTYQEQPIVITEPPTALVEVQEIEMVKEFKSQPIQKATVKPIAEQCRDDADYPQTFKEQERDESLFYDPNWVVKVEKQDGCFFYFHPNQGQGNGVAEAELKEDK
jgi:hypothetical protein